MGGFGLGRFSPRGWFVLTLIPPQHLLSERSGRSFAVLANPVKSGGRLSRACASETIFSPQTAKDEGAGAVAGFWITGEAIYRQLRRKSVTLHRGSAKGVRMSAIRHNLLPSLVDRNLR